MKKLIILVISVLFLTSCTQQKEYLELQDMISDVNSIYSVLNDYFPYDQAVVERTSKNLEHHKMVCLDTLNQEMNQLSYQRGSVILDQCLEDIGTGKIELITDLSSLDGKTFEDILSDKKVIKTYDILKQEYLNNHETSKENLMIKEDATSLTIKVMSLSNSFRDADESIISDILEKTDKKEIILDLTEARGNDKEYLESVILDTLYQQQISTSYIAKVKNDTIGYLDEYKAVYTPVYNSYCKQLDAGASGCIIVEDVYDAKASNDYNVVVQYSSKTTGIALNLISASTIASEMIDEGISYNSPVVSMGYFKLPATGFIFGFYMAHPFNSIGSLVEENGNK